MSKAKALIEAMEIQKGDFISVAFNAAPITAMPTASGKIATTLLHMTVVFERALDTHIVCSRTAEDGKTHYTAYHMDSIMITTVSKLASSQLVVPDLA